MQKKITRFVTSDLLPRVLAGMFVLVFGVLGTMYIGGSFAATPKPKVATTAAFNSNTDPNVGPQFQVFASLPASTKSLNDQMVTAINHAATTAQKNEARRTSDFPYTSTKISIPEALGSNLSAKLVALEAQGKLPLTVALLRQNNGSSTHSILEPSWASEDGLKAHFNYQRPYCRIPKSIIKVSPATSTPSNHSIYGACNGKQASFPSGHSREAYEEGVTLATFLPELAPQIMARTAQVANNRLVVGVHYPLDIMGGRELAERMIALRYHDPVWRKKLLAARTELRSALEKACGGTIAQCAAAETPYMPTADALSISTGYLTYKCAIVAYCITPTSGFPQIGKSGVALTAPDYSYELLSVAAPTKTPAQLNQILASTAIDSGYPLDTTSAGVSSANTGWSRIDLARGLVLSAQTAAPTPTPAPTPAPTPTPKPTPAPAATPSKSTNSPSSTFVQSNPSSSTNSPVAVSVGPPAAPTNLTAKVADGSSVKLTWSGNAASYIVERSVDTTSWNVLDTSTTDTTYYDTVTDFDTQYYYRVTADNGNGETSAPVTAQVRTNKFSSTAADKSNDAKLESSDGVLALSIPQDALSKPATCWLAKNPTLPSYEVQKYQLVGGPYQIMCQQQDGTFVDTFTKPVTVTIDLSKAIGGSYGSYVLAGFDNGQQSWQEFAMPHGQKPTQISVKLDSKFMGLSVYGQSKHSSSATRVGVVLSSLVLITGVVLFGLRRLALLQLRRAEQHAQEDYWHKMNGV